MRLKQRRDRRLVGKVEAVQRLVEDQHPRAADERLGDQQPLLLAARALADRPLGVGARADQLDHLPTRAREPRATLALKRAAEGQRHAPAVARRGRGGRGRRRASAWPSRSRALREVADRARCARPAGRRAPRPSLQPSVGRGRAAPSAASTCRRRWVRAPRRTRRSDRRRTSTSAPDRAAATERSPSGSALAADAPSARGLIALASRRLVERPLEAFELCHLPLLEGVARRRERLGDGGDRDVTARARCALTRWTSGVTFWLLKTQTLISRSSAWRSTVSLVLRAHFGALGDRLDEAVGRQQLQAEALAEWLEDALAVADRRRPRSGGGSRRAARCSGRARRVSKCVLVARRSRRASAGSTLS